MSVAAPMTPRALLATVLIGIFLITACAPAPPAKKKSSPVFEDDTKEGQKTKKKGGMDDDADPAGELERRGGPDGTPEEAQDELESQSPAAPSSCTKDVECGAVTRICDPKTSQCIKGCRDASGCPSGEVCSTNSQCEKRPPPSTADECMEDTECELGFICTGTSGNKRCTAGCRTTFDCPFDEHCENGPLGQCVADAPAPSPSTGAECISDGACNPGNNGAGKICEGGRCVAGCRKDLHCPGLTICVLGTCK